LHYHSRDNPGLPSQLACPISQIPQAPIGQNTARYFYHTAQIIELPKYLSLVRSDEPNAATQNRQALSFDSNSRWVPSWTSLGCPPSKVKSSLGSNSSECSRRIPTTSNLSPSQSSRWLPPSHLPR